MPTASTSSTAGHIHFARSDLEDGTVKSLLSLPRLALKLRLPCEWLHQEALAGRLPCLKVGRRFLFNAAAVERALAERAAKPIVDNNQHQEQQQEHKP
jgi:hypothetical protein